MEVVLAIVTVFFVGAMIIVAKESGEFSTKRDDDKGEWIVYFEDGTFETYDSYKEANDRYNSCSMATKLGTIK